MITVHAHGTFDLLHPGHIKHLQDARKMGDRLVVSITADEFVAKGPGRPVYNHTERREMLKALDCVDDVMIVHDITAIPAIETIRPNIYVKGAEYVDEAADVTGNIAREREAVEAHGGRIAYTNGETKSSSEIINRHLPRENGDYLARVRDGGGLERLLGLIESVRNYKVLFIGDAITDEYIYVTPLGKSPKENMIAVRKGKSERFEGGVHAVANHARTFVKHVDVVHGPTSIKSRLVSMAGTSVQKLMGIYEIEEQGADCYGDWVKQLGTYDLVVSADFGHGAISRQCVEAIQGEAVRFLSVNAQTNSANYGFNLVTKYKRADYICVDASEARLALQDQYGDPGTLAERLSSRPYVQAAVVTDGKRGAVGSGIAGMGVHKTVRAPALTSNAVDTLGTGDAFFSITSLFARAGASLDDLLFLGNLAGASKVGVVGYRGYMEKPAFVKAMTGLLK